MNVLLVDDHALYRDGIAQLLYSVLPDMNLLEAYSCQSAINCINTQTLDFALIDLRLPDGSGLELLDQLVEIDPLLSVVIISGIDDYAVIKQVLLAGASGFFPKYAPRKVMKKALKQVLAGEIYSPLEDKELTFEKKEQNLPVSLQDQLTNRQSKVLLLLAEGLSNKNIASQLYISEKTVKAHLSTIFSILKVSSRSEAIVRILELRFLM